MLNVIGYVIKAGLPFGLLMSVFFWFVYDWRTALLGGLGSGLLFGISMAGFLFFQSLKFTKNRPLLPDEKLIKEGPANHFFNGESVGGWVYLTDRRFYFKSHGVNAQNHELPIALETIGSVEKTNHLGLIPNGLNLALQNGATEKFVVHGSKEWVKVISSLI